MTCWKYTQQKKKGVKDEFSAGSVLYAAVSLLGTATKKAEGTPTTLKHETAT